MDLLEKLEKIDDAINKLEFRQSKGLGNEVGYYIFDYPENEELTVREYVKKLKAKKDLSGDFEIVIYDLYEMMIDYLESQGLLEACYEMEENYGLNYLVNSVVELLNLDSDETYFTKEIEMNTPKDAVVFVVGIGKIFPFARAHNILNKTHQVFDRVPVVMFYPGEWDGQSLKLFSEIDDGNYYRAFRLV